MQLKKIVITGSLLMVLVPCAPAQERIYRCGNEYTNSVSAEKAKTCKLVEGANVTVVQDARATRPASARAPASAAAMGAGGPRVDAADQRARDSDARLILQSELRKAEARHAELLKEYNNGTPDKIGGEARNHQKYLDRVAELKAGIERNEADIAGIRRELERLPAGAASR